jgi:hypothetical protein
MNSPRIPAVLCVVIHFLTQLQGAVVTDQQVGYSGSFGYGVLLRENESVGQSFTPELSSIQFITINTLTSANFNTPVETTLRLGLFLGEDRSEAALASSPDILVSSRMVETPSGEFTIVSYVIDPVTWSFDSPLPIQSGVRYSFQIDYVSGDDLMWTASPEPYSGGRGLFTGFGGVENESMNFSFSEGVLIPEPSPIFMASGGALILAASRRRRIEQAVAPNRSLPPSLNSSSSVRGSED